MAFLWTPDLTTGIDIIDEQHQEIFIIINKLLATIREGKGKDEIGNTIKFLDNYCKDHFAMEEKYAIQYFYPDYPQLKSEHDGFRKDFEKFKEGFEANGPSSYIVIQVQQRICDWLVYHIKKIDMELGHFLSGKL